MLRLNKIDLIAILLPSLGYFAIALTSSINLGYRHLLPVLPFFFVFIATTQHSALSTSAPALRATPHVPPSSSSFYSGSPSPHSSSSPISWPFLTLWRVAQIMAGRVWWIATWIGGRTSLG
ncbi:MAG: hypothetical protein IPL78_25795 [Chloroflexi bacterium]|nr:hypothetical protein [Chloroflexota bacterium]